MDKQFHGDVGESPHIVQTRGLSKTFDLEDSSVIALQDVNLDVRPGEFVSFVGRSGCGKSTLLNMVAGLLAPTSGDVRVNGTIVTEPPEVAGFMFQAPVLLPWRTIEENVFLPAQIHKKDTPDLRDKARRVLRTVGLGDFLTAYPKQLSGGMQQRAALARVLTYEPKLLLMDEPFGALDEFTREAMNLELMRLAAEAGITVLFVTHNISEAVFMSDRVVVMTPRPGKVAGIIDVPLARPRQIEAMQDPSFTDLVFEIRSILGRAHDHHE
jgi:NitT/TauT family transport system ATP-binding protein